MLLLVPALVVEVLSYLCFTESEQNCGYQYMAAIIVGDVFHVPVM